MQEESPEESFEVENTASEGENAVEASTSETQEKFEEYMPVVPLECADISGGNVFVYSAIYVGDNEFDNEIRGFISFDISKLLGTTIESAKISGKSSIISGTPFKTYGPLIIKAVYWGPRQVTPGDFNLDGVEIVNLLAANFGKSPGVLKNDLQNVVNSNINRYQLCLYFEMSQTDGDGKADYVLYDLSDISLNVTYTK